MGNQIKLDGFVASEAISRVQYSDFPRAKFIEHVFLHNKPLIIEGGTADWPAASWNLQNIVQDIPDQQVQVRNNRSGRLFDPENMAHDKTQMSLHEFVDTIRQGKNETPLYMAQTNFAGLVQNPLDFIKRYPYLRRMDYLLQSNLWIGTPGLATPAHYDFAHNFYHQISGHKHITLFAPEDTCFLYPNPAIPLVSLVDVASPDVERFPEFKLSNPISFVVGPGESVFIPAGWWHYIASTYDNNISINQWYLRLWSRNTSQLRMIPPLVAAALRHLKGRGR